MPIHRCRRSRWPMSIALAKKEPGKYSAGTPPAPTLNYFAAKLFNVMGGVDITVVAYKGTGPLTNDLLGNHVPLGFNTIPASVSQIAGRPVARRLRSPAATRSAALPNVPTAAESGLPGFEAVQYYGARRAGRDAAADRRADQCRIAQDLDVRRHEKAPDRPPAAIRRRRRPTNTPPIFSARKANGRRWSRSSD